MNIAKSILTLIIIAMFCMASQAVAQDVRTVVIPLEVTPQAQEILDKVKGVDGSGSGLDADLLDGQEGSYYLDWSNFTGVPAGFSDNVDNDSLSDVESSGCAANEVVRRNASDDGWECVSQSLFMIPQGVIMMWSGSIASIPTGWALCDGTNDTPDLRDRFVLGTLVGQDPGESGGSHTVGLNGANLPSHSHTFTTDMSGAHQHQYLDYVAPAYSTDFWIGGVVPTSLHYAQDLENYTRETFFGDGDHNHPGTTDTAGSGQGFDNRPAYYRLAFIMKM